MAAETGHGDATKGIFWDALRPFSELLQHEQLRATTSNYE